MTYHNGPAIDEFEQHLRAIEGADHMRICPPEHDPDGWFRHVIAELLDLSRGLRVERDAARDIAQHLQEVQTQLEELHQPEKRWQPHPDCEYSFDTAEEAADEIDGDGEPTFFEVCAHCGDIEFRHAGEYADYLDSLWPCSTIHRRTLGGLSNDR